MNIFAAIIFSLLCLFGGSFILLTSEVEIAKNIGSWLFPIIVFLGYISAAIGVMLALVGAIGFAFKRNEKFWMGFQPVNFGLLISFSSLKEFGKSYSLMTFVLSAITLIVLLALLWKYILRWRAIPIILIFSGIVTINSIGVAQLLHLAVAVIFVVIPMFLILQEKMKTRKLLQ